MASSKHSNASERSQVLHRVTEVLQSQRRRVDGFLTESSRSLDELESRFVSEFEAFQQQCEEWETFQDQLQQRFQALEKERSEVEHRHAELATRASEVERAQQETKEQRRRAAQKLEDRRRQWLAEQSDSATDLQNKLLELEQQLADAQEELADAKAEAEVNREAVVGQQRTIDERDELIARLTTESRESSESINHDRQAMVDMQLRYEMAMESVESLREKNDLLEEEIAQLQSTAASAPHYVSTGGGAGEENWEATKRRLLANLDSDDISADDQERIEETIQRTESQMAEKDREIEELRAQLAEALENASPEPSSSVASERDSVLSADKVVAAERAKLAQLQADLHDQLRNAEIECARERANNTRLRSELQEKLRDLETELARARGNNSGAGKTKGSGRRWLDHLGLQPDGK